MRATFQVSVLRRNGTNPRIMFEQLVKAERSAGLGVGSIGHKSAYRVVLKAENIREAQRFVDHALDHDPLLAAVDGPAECVQVGTGSVSLIFFGRT